MTRDEALFWLVVVGVAPALYLAGWGLSKVPRLVRGWRYDWAEAKHLTGLPVVEEVPDRDFYGSMSLADEAASRADWQAVGDDLRWAMEHFEPDWLAQTRAELTPEALDSGPGETPSVDPGPDPDDEHMPTETAADWGARLRCEVLAWRKEPWATTMPWEAKVAA